jgi:hypothetical protein
MVDVGGREKDSGGYSGSPFYREEVVLRGHAIETAFPGKTAQPTPLLVNIAV